MNVIFASLCLLVTWVGVEADENFVFKIVNEIQQIWLIMVSRENENQRIHSKV